MSNVYFLVFIVVFIVLLFNFFRFCIALCWSCLLKRSINQTEFDWFSVGMLSFTFDSTHNWEHTQSLHIIIDWHIVHRDLTPNYIGRVAKTYSNVNAVFWEDIDDVWHLGGLHIHAG